MSKLTRVGQIEAKSVSGDVTVNETQDAVRCESVSAPSA